MALRFFRCFVLGEFRNLAQLLISGLTGEVPHSTRMDGMRVNQDLPKGPIDIWRLVSIDLRSGIYSNAQFVEKERIDIGVPFNSFIE